MSPSNCIGYKLYSRLEEVEFAGPRAVLGTVVHGKPAAAWTQEYRKAFRMHLEDLEVFVRNEGVRRQMFQHRGSALSGVSTCLWQHCNKKINT